MTRLKLPHIHEYRDRHGKLRRYVRIPGRRGVALPGLPGSPEFMGAYQAATSGDAEPPRRGKVAAGTLRALIVGFYRSTEFANLKPSSQALYRLALDPLSRADGHRMVRDMPRDKARKIIEEIGAKRPGMANLTRDVLRRLMSYAISLGLRNDNPIAGIPRYKLGTYHTWTEQEISVFEQRWPLGTRERLAFALLLYTGQRTGDVVRMKRGDIRNGTISLAQQKTGQELTIAIHPALERAIKAGPSRGLYLIGDAAGRPVHRSTISAVIRSATDKAGLPKRCVAHGLRKAAMRRLAEHGSSANEIAAVSGHQTLKEVERYTRGADQARLARAAIKRLPDEG